MKDQDTRNKKEKNKQPWHRPQLVELGRLTDLVQGGGGKLTGAADDPGETRKTSPTG